MLPLADDPVALVAALSAIDDDIVRVVEIEDPNRKVCSLVEPEWIGLEHALEGPTKVTRGANTTSIDALVLAETKSGRRAYLLEWKYVEEYRKHYLGDGSRGNTRRERYGKLYFDSPSFRDDVPLNAWFYEPFYQIFRQILLANRMVKNRELDVSSAKVVIVVPKGNLAYRERITSPTLASMYPNEQTIEGVVRSALVRPDEEFACISPANMADAVRGKTGDRLRDWSEYHLSRYGW